MKKFLGVFCLFLLFCTSVAAQVDNIGEGISYKELSSRLARTEKLIKQENTDNNRLVDETQYLNTTAITLRDARQDIDSQIKLVEKRIEALGAINENVPEAKVIAQKRLEFTKELSDEKTKLSEIDILIAKIDELNLKIFNIRNQYLWGNLLNPEGILVIPSVFYQANRELVELGVDIIQSPYKWYRNLTPQQHTIVKDNIFTVAFLIVLIIVVGYFLRRMIIRRFGYQSDIELPRMERKIIAAIAVWCAYGIIPTAIIGFCLYWITIAGLMSQTLFGMVISSSLYYLLYIIMGIASFRVALTPFDEKWRLINLSTDKAKRIMRAVSLTIILVGICAFLQELVTRNNYSLELLSYLMAISSSLKACALVWIARIFFASSVVKGEDEELTAEENDQERKAFRVGILVSLFAIFIIGLSLFGYARLASFIVNRSIFTAILLAVFSILRRLVHDILQRVLLMGLWVKSFRMRRMFLRKLDFWFGIIIEPLLFLLLLAVILLLWGMPFDILQATVYKAISGFTIGGVKISLISIFWGMVAFIICLWFIRLIRNRIEFSLLEKTNIDSGTKHSLASGFAYIGYVLAGLLAVAIMGANLTNIALIAGALSVGIGLGLQDVVNNFVSGIIMLFERPIKVGDWVMINGEEGKVKQINIRSTEIETFNRASVIIPNSKVLSNAVTNLTHENNWQRYSIKIGIAYGTDIERVRDILLECALSHPKVVKKPAPYVVFQDFGDNSLIFDLRFYVNDIWNGWSAPSDIRFIINKRFIEECIEIPFKQMVVHYGCAVGEKTEGQFYAKKKKGKKNAD